MQDRVSNERGIISAVELKAREGVVACIAKVEEASEQFKRGVW